MIISFQTNAKNARTIGATNVVVNNASNRNATNNSTAIAQQSGSSASSLRQQSSNAMGSASTSGAGGSGGSTALSVNNATKDAGIVSKQEQLSLQDMPFEILDKILSYVGYKQVSSMRLVSTIFPLWCALLHAIPK